MKEFKRLVDLEVNRLFLKVFPPLGEDKKLDIDISIGLVFSKEPNQMCIISTDEEDRWMPSIHFSSIPKRNIYSWSSFNNRMKDWMDLKEYEKLDIEYYEVTNTVLFNNLVSQKILNVEFLSVKNIELPFGVKLIFDKDYILSTPTADGNTIETSSFNKNKNITNFEELGELEFSDIEHRAT